MKMQAIILSEHKSILLAELAQARELTLQLEAHCRKNSPSDFCKTLTPKILSAIDKSIYIANTYGAEVAGDFLRSASDTPSSENSGQLLREQNQKETCKKRKTQQKWTSQLRLRADAGAIDGPAGDVYSWRKYGQKDILGTKYPRSYYRCTHRNSQGCFATKQVQRSDADPQVFDITYHGTHTCLNGSQATATSARREHQQKQNDGVQNQDILLNFQTGLQVKTEGLNFEREQNHSAPFGCGIKPENVFSSPSTPENGLGRPSCPAFFSPKTSESTTYFSVSPCRMNSLELEHKLLGSESDVAELISTPLSSCSSTVMDMEFMFNFGTDFNFDQFDASGFFS